MKIYMHLEQGEHNCTLICRVEDTARVQTLVKAFVEQYEGKYGKKLDSDRLQLLHQNRGSIELKKRVGNVLKDLDDVFLVLPESETKASQSEGAAKTVTEKRKTDVPVAKTKAKEEEVNQDLHVFTELITRGEQDEAENNLRKASDHYQTVLQACPHHKRALVHLMQLWTKVGRPQVAEKWCETCLSRYSDDLSVLMAAGKLKHASGDHEMAIRLFNKAIGIAKKKPVHAFPLQDIEICAANAMYSVGESWENAAVQLVMSVVEPERTHFEGLLLYARIAFDRGLVEDAVRVFLRLIMQKNEYEDVKKYLAACFEKPGALDFVMRELKSGPGLGSAYAFIAARIKDYGAIQPAIQLYERAVQSDPEDPSIALNYMHTMELLLHTDKIMSFARSFLRESKVHLIRNFECKEIGRLLEDMPLIGQGAEYGWLRMEEWKPHPQTESVEEIVEKVEFGDVQLDMLASLFTVVKVLFVGGALERAFKAIQSIALCCKASEKKLHTTTIRNEAAYFNCIRQMLEEYPPSEVTDLQDVRPLYLCGDSHCLSAAWQRVELHGMQHILVPKLVTGCKVWHLRRESSFYPKKGFEQTMQSMPKKASVVLNFGEIDCRTGIGLAVEKCKYDSQAAAIKKTVSIYVQVIKDLVKEHEFVIYVHPVPPALEVTRPIVCAYNAVLKAAIQDVAALKRYKKQIYWLDFFDDLLTPDGLQLKPEFEFDETHLAPNYTALLRQALVKCESE